MAPWLGIIVPLNTPKPIVDKLTTETLAVMADPAAVKQFTDQQLVVMTLPGDKFMALIKKDHAKWQKVIESAGIKPE
jgi:tripartite-type tricarboxylate transporter receptor subunit TctC